MNAAGRWLGGTGIASFILILLHPLFRKKALIAAAEPGVLPKYAGIMDSDEQGKSRVDVLKLRATEFRDRYESMWSLEWNIIFQTYAGYAAIAIAFKYLSTDGDNPKKMVAWLAVLATSVLYLISRYLTYRIQERLRVFDKMHDLYMDELDSAFEIPPIKFGRGSLGHRYFWTFHSQLILSTLTFVGLVAYEAAYTGAVHESFSSFALFFVIVLMLVLVGWFVRPPEPDVRWGAHAKAEDHSDEMRKAVQT